MTGCGDTKDKSKHLFHRQCGRQQVDQYISSISKAVGDLIILEKDLKQIRRNDGCTKSYADRKTSNIGGASSYADNNDIEIDLAVIEKAVSLCRCKKKTKYKVSFDTSSNSERMKTQKDVPKPKEDRNQKRKENLMSRQLRIKTLAEPKPRNKGICIFAQRVLPDGSLPPSSMGSSFLVVIPPSSANNLTDVCERITKVSEEHLNASQPEIKDLFTEDSKRITSCHEIKDGSLISYRCTGDLCRLSNVNPSWVRRQKSICNRLSLPKAGCSVSNVSFQHLSSACHRTETPTNIVLHIIPPNLYSLEQLYKKLETIIADNFLELPQRPIRALYDDEFELIESLSSIESHSNYYFSCFGDIAETRGRMKVMHKESDRCARTSNKTKKRKVKYRKKKGLKNEKKMSSLKESDVLVNLAPDIDTIDLYIHNVT